MEDARCKIGKMVKMQGEEEIEDGRKMQDGEEGRLKMVRKKDEER